MGTYDSVNVTVQSTLQSNRNSHAVLLYIVDVAKEVEEIEE